MGKHGDQPESPLDRRRAGVLLHPTSLPSPGPIGTLGTDAFRFVDFLAAAGFTVWQVLPLGPAWPMGSPYQTESAHAGNPWLICMETLMDWGWLPQSTPPEDPDQWFVWHREQLLQARAGFIANADRDAKHAYDAFCESQRYWLDDYVLFRVLRREHHGSPWWRWEPELRAREPEAIAKTRERLAEVLDEYRFEQFLFYRQWMALKHYANQRGVLLFGDMPIFVAHDSADVWAEPQYFDLDAEFRLRNVAGVPPDYFSATGQRWGNPLYNWKNIEADHFGWWERRFRTLEDQFDLVRVDHFRGFEAFWEIPADEETAMNGHWVEAPGNALFERMLKRLGRLPLVAEDLGIITPPVEALRDGFGFPGMKILQFAFDGGPNNPYLPDHHVENCVVYTGTHDNDTTLGWFNALSDEQQRYITDYLGFPDESMPWPLIRTALNSVGLLAVLPMQDLLELDGEHRMNTPGTETGNWRWRFSWDDVEQGLAAKTRHLVELYDRR